MNKNQTTPRKPVAKYTVILSSNCLGKAFPPLDSPEITCAEIEPHGAVTIMRFTSCEEAEQFDLSSVEVDALIAANRRRHALMKRYLAERAPSSDLGDLDDYPF